MRQEEGRDIIKQLANNVDVLVENFRPGVMEKWKLGPKVSECLCSFPGIIACLQFAWSCLPAAGIVQQDSTCKVKCPVAIPVLPLPLSPCYNCLVALLRLP